MHVQTFPVPGGPKSKMPFHGERRPVKYLKIAQIVHIELVKKKERLALIHMPSIMSILSKLCNTRHQHVFNILH